jgi:carbon monoxide dehydrogenase subunit G
MRVEIEFPVAASAARVWHELSDPSALASAIAGPALTTLDGGAGYLGTLGLELDSETVRCTAIVRPVDTDEDSHTVTCQLQVREVDGPGIAIGLLRGTVSGDGDAVVSLSLEGRLAAPHLDERSLTAEAESALASVAAMLAEALGADAERAAITPAAPTRDSPEPAPPAATSRRPALIAGLAAAVALAAVVVRARRRARGSG